MRRFLTVLFILAGVTISEAQVVPHAARIHQALTTAGVIVDSVSVGTVGVAASVTVKPASQQVAAQPTINAYDWSDSASNTYENLKSREDAIKFYAAIRRGDSSLWRASALVLIDELNILRQWIAAFKVEVAAATSLADLKTRVGTLPATPDRTPSQATTAITNKINSGVVDSAP